ncbi:MAG TPA: (d)CMP kinase [Burkholderiaceae bacterium]|jgi:cytidylate kinase|nr:(d)CMP kinase [Burkholderiaceae bacterium]
MNEGNTNAQAPVIAIDGPTASGKGTIALGVANALGWHSLDSGALYRLVALQAMARGIALDDAAALARLTGALAITHGSDGLLLDGHPVGDDIRREEVGIAASRIAALAPVRAALLPQQRAARRPPGLVADGRDMGTVVFQDAELKVFLTASAESRATRRHKQLIEKGFSANVDDLLQDLRVRDQRDASREHAPLQAAAGAVIIDSTHLDVAQTIERVLQEWRRRVV